MPSVVALLDAWKRRNGVKNDAEAARRLGVSRQAVSHWRNEGKQPQARVLVKLCAETGIDPMAFLDSLTATDAPGETAQLSFPEIEPTHRAA